MSDATPNTSTLDIGAPGALEGLIIGLVGSAQPIAPDERRLRERFPIYCKMLLTPIDRNHEPIIDKAADIFGKDISTAGMCFTHELPLLYQRIAISLTHPDIGQLNVEAEIVWTRQTLIGLYESGCRLIRKIAGHNISLRPH